MDRETAQSMLGEGRGLLRDLHHGLREEQAVRDAETLSYLIARAEEAGAPAEHLDEMRRQYLSIVHALMKQSPKRRRRPWSRRERPSAELAAVSRPRELPPG